MKASKFKKLRRLMRPFMVLRSYGMFGDFSHPGLYKKTGLLWYTKVMARSPKEAAYRYMKRNHTVKEFCNYDNRPDETSEQWAKLKVMPADTPFARFVKYYK
jgi:hypothetical protein